MIKVYFDGSCEPNPGGIVRYGAIIEQHDKILYEISKKVNLDPSITSNNVAEYCGLIASMKWLIHHQYTDKEIYFFGDSKLVINQMLGLWNLNDGKYIKFAEQARNLFLSFKDIHFEWIPKEQNSRADLLSRRVR